MKNRIKNDIIKVADDMTNADLAEKLLLEEITFHSNGQKKYELIKDGEGHTCERYWNKNGGLVKEIYDGDITYLMSNPPFNTKLKNT